MFSRTAVSPRHRSAVLLSMETRSFVLGTERMDTKILSGSERKGHKRKLADTSLGLLATDGVNNRLIVDVRAQVTILKACSSGSEPDRLASRRAAHALAELAKHGKFFNPLSSANDIDALPYRACLPSC